MQLAHYADMNNYLISNLQYLLESAGQSERALADLVGSNQVTLNRILREKIAEPRDSTLKPYADYFGVDVTELKYKDLRSGSGEASSSQEADQSPRAKRDTCRILLLDDFPNATLMRNSPILAVKGLEVSRYWLSMHTSAAVSEVRYAYSPDDSMQGQIEKGDIIFVDTTVSDVVTAGIYAFTYFGQPNVRYGQVSGKGSLRFTGTKSYANSLPIEGDEFEGLKIAGLVFASWSFKTL